MLHPSAKKSKSYLFQWVMADEVSLKKDTCCAGWSAFLNKRDYSQLYGVDPCTTMEVLFVIGFLV